MTLEFSRIEEQIVRQLPEILPAANNYWKQEGRPGDDCGAYIFFEGMFATYVIILLHLPPSKERNRLLIRVYELLDLMLTSNDNNVHDLGYIGLLEGREAWFLRQSEPFLGIAAQKELDTWRSGWRTEILNSNLSPADEIIDLYDVRSIIAKELTCDLSIIPGRAYIPCKENAT